MMRWICTGVLLFPLFFAFACTRPDFIKTSPDGQFSLLTYNIAGLPQGISSSNPAVNIPLISPLLNLYDIVLVQEDFSFHHETISRNGQPYISEPGIFRGLVGDGLNRLSYCTFELFQRQAWSVCSGYFDRASDCLTMKGFSFGRHQLTENISVDIYNLHMDAGRAYEDYEARKVQTEQLITFVLNTSADRAVIIAGDFNMRYNDSEDILNLTALISIIELTDAAVFFGNDNDRIDKILFRSGYTCTLAPVSYSVDSVRFNDAAENPLSDHEPVSVLFSFE